QPPSAPVFGPKQYTRTTGAPNEFVDTFSVPASIRAPFLLRVVNGDASGRRRNSSASIKINGKEVLKSSDCSERVGTVERTVELKASNTIEVRLASTPGSVL